MTKRLIYVHDPMCSWCWGFAPVLEDFLHKLPDDITVVRLLGGLAPDNDEVMPVELQQQIQSTWKRIQEKIPGTRFNFDFWEKCIPRRSTYLSCRAVIAARKQGEEFDKKMTTAIQHAYYLEAKNPSDKNVLVQLAQELGLDAERFRFDLESPGVNQALMEEIEQSRKMHVSSFPSIMLQPGETSTWPVVIDYRDSAPMLELVQKLMEKYA